MLLFQLLAVYRCHYCSIAITAAKAAAQSYLRALCREMQQCGGMGVFMRKTLRASAAASLTTFSLLRQGPQPPHPPSTPSQPM